MSAQVRKLCQSKTEPLGIARPLGPLVPTGARVDI